MDDNQLLRHMDNVGLRISFSQYRGAAFQREWTWREVFSGLAPDWIFRPDPPWWLEKGKELDDPPEWEWHDPLNPVLLTGRITDGYEDVARSWIWPER